MEGSSLTQALPQGTSFIIETLSKHGNVTANFAGYADGMWISLRQLQIIFSPEEWEEVRETIESVISRRVTPIATNSKVVNVNSL